MAFLTSRVAFAHNSLVDTVVAGKVAGMGFDKGSEEDIVFCCAFRSSELKGSIVLHISWPHDY